MVDSEEDQPPELLALASRFGGSRIALLAAKQALRSRQASAEASRADVGPPEAQQPPPRQQSGTAGDDEALALGALLNRQGRGEPGLQLRRPPPPVVGPERSSAAAGDSWQADDELATARSLPSSQLADSRSYEDAAMDTVLAGSPVGGSPVASHSSLEDCCPVAERSAAAAALPSPACLASPPAPALQPPLPERSPSPIRQPQPCAARTAVQQRVWSFEAIPQGTASIPGARSGGEQQQPAPRAAGAGDRRPAFYTRAASPPQRPLSAVPAPAKPAPAATVAQQRQQRLEQLARPKHAAPLAWRRQQGQQGQQAPSELTAAADAEGNQPAAGPSNSKSTSTAAHAKSAAPSACVLASSAANTSPQNTIPAWRPGSSAATCWPQQLGREPDAAELQRATGAYSAERFERNLGALSALLARRQQARAAAAGAAAAGVDAFVAEVRQVQMPSGTSGTPGPAGDAGSTGSEAGQHTAKVEDAEDEQPRCSSPAARDEGEHPCCSATTAAAAAPEEEALPHSPTERLLRSCERLRAQRQQPRPETAPRALPGEAPGSPLRRLQRPATGSPGGVKTLMQVKREQDRAVQELRQQARPFKAPPLPLSSLEPRFQRQEEEREARRAASHDARRQQLLAEQRPFGFDAREAERRERQRLVHGEEGAAALAARPATPTVPFHAQPVPVSTSEARYALLVAEMQLTNRSVRGKGLASPPRRPATGAAASPTRLASPARRPATAAAHERVERWEAVAATRSSTAPRSTTTTVLECSEAAQQGDAAETLQHTLPAGAVSAAADTLPDTLPAVPLAAAAALASEPAPAAAAPAASTEPPPPAPAAPVQRGRPAAAGQQEQCLPPSSSPATQRLGSRGPSTDGAPEAQPSWASRPPRPPSSRPPAAAAPPTGIAVPVGSPAGGRLAMAAGAGAELLPALVRPATREGAPQPGAPPGMQLGSPRGMQPGSPARRPWEERRDTPPQHIAARHRQAEAAVRAEVAAVLRKRGGGVVALMQRGPEELA